MTVKRHIISYPPSLPRLCWQGQREQKKSASCTWCCTQRHRRLRLRSLLRDCCLRHLENERKIRSVSEVQCPSDRAAPNDRARAAATFARVQRLPSLCPALADFRRACVSFLFTDRHAHAFPCVCVRAMVSVATLSQISHTFGLSATVGSG